MSDICPVCGNSAEFKPSNIDGEIVNCKRCGDYKIAGTLQTMLNITGLSENEKVLMSGYIINNQDILLHGGNYKKILKSIRMPTVAEKVNKIMLLLERIDSKPGAIIDISDNTANCFRIKGSAFITDKDEWEYLFRDYLSKKLEFIKIIPHGGNAYDNKPIKFDLKIAPAGWKYIEEIKSSNQNSNTAFIAMWFSPKVEETRKSIKQAIQDAGYDPKIIDEVEHNDDITDKIITLINRARFVVADFTEQRSGVYYEAGYAKGINIPVIHTVKEKEIGELHFDINHQNFIAWNETNLSEFQEKLTNRITATIGDGPNINTKG